ncbi:uncharacterized protein [Rutidosis leptorrhynchoides]|uniref:uncharacterized protein n=1 Tax=Rutidosis leptorrhynchoides TaxID=125765 RepID=UPI003A9933A6
MKGYQAILANVKKVEPEEKRIEDVPVVREFPDVFPEELPGLPPQRQVKFQIDLTPVELKKANPGTTFKVGTEACDEDATSMIFKRVYIYLGPLKSGFQALGRDLLGLDGPFVKEPARGQLLTVVGVDSNNGIYHVAYAIVEKETYNSWLWFSNNLGEDLDLNERSNFTFISDRQKGLLPAIERLYPFAKHRYCLRHIHENMKKNYSGVAYKQMLWKCATTTTVPHFKQEMQKLKDFSEGCHKFLADIQPHHWARSHFSGKTMTDVLLNNMCEVLNRWLVDARDKPIITALEYIREYLMKRIVTVNNMISKSDGPLTPGATKVFDGIKKQAEKYTVMWNGDQLYQVSGPHNDQCVVDMNAKVCACRK